MIDVVWVGATLYIPSFKQNKKEHTRTDNSVLGNFSGQNTFSKIVALIVKDG